MSCLISVGAAKRRPFFDKKNKMKHNKIFDAKPGNISRIFSTAGFPGEQLDKTIDEVRKEYILCRKIYGELYNLNVGQNNDLTVNLPASARFLIGISYYSAFQNDAENPLISYRLNNSLIIQKTPVRALIVNNLNSQVYYPIGLSLSGQDQHIVNINEINQAKAVSVIFHYV